MSLSGDLTYRFGDVIFSGPNARLNTENSTGSGPPPVFSLLRFDQDGLITGNNSTELLSVANQHTLLLENGSTLSVLFLVLP